MRSCLIAKTRCRRGKVRPRPSRRGYVLRGLALRVATERDHERARLFEILARAATSERLGTMQSLREAVPLYQEAAAGWRTVRDVLLEAETLEALAHLTGYFTEYHRESVAAHERLVEIYPQLGEVWQEIHNLRGLGQSYSEGGRFDEAKQVATRATELAMSRGFKRSAATVARHGGIYEFELGNYDQARGLALEAQQLAAAIPDRALEALTLSDLARLDAIAGRFHQRHRAKPARSRALGRQCRRFEPHQLVSGLLSPRSR